MPSNDAAYQRSYREQNVAYVVRDRIVKKARTAAMTRLMQAHLDEYRRYVAEECRRLGVEPPSPRGDS